MPFDIVITDLAMPDVDGRQVVASLRAISAATPIILLTGWRHQLADGVERPLEVDRLLGKPPRIRELRAALAELSGRRVTDRLLRPERNNVRTGKARLITPPDDERSADHAPGT